jgi:hypothetical protein
MIPLGILAAQAPPAPAGAYELISSTILTSNTASVTFSSIPATFKHLQVRYVARATSTGNATNIVTTINNNTGSNYAVHELIGDGSSVSSSGFSGLTAILRPSIPDDALTAGMFAAGVVDLLDYSSVSKNKTIRFFNGVGARNVTLVSGLFVNTAATTSITFATQEGSLKTGTRFSLYGIRG